MKLPSIKTIESRLNISNQKAKQVRKRLESFKAKYYNRLRGCSTAPLHCFKDISDIIGGFGCEFIPAGHNAKSPSIYYVNMGDTYDETVLYYRGNFHVHSWGNIVERCNYD